MTSEIRTNIIKSRAGLSTVSYADTGIIVSGIVTATSFSGSGANLTNLPTATNITVADESTDTTCFPLYATAASGNLAPKTGSNLTFNSSSGNLRSTSLFLGEGSNESKAQNGLIMERNSGDGIIHISAGRSGGTYGGFNFYVAGDTGGADSNIKLRHQMIYDGSFRWYDSDGTTERLRIDSSGNVDVKTGNLVIGTAGKGIDFSAQTHPTAASGVTVNAELLDHYEEGTFQPLLKRLMTNGTTETNFYNQGTRQGNYQRVGNRVWVTARIHWSGGGTGSGSLILTNLPYTPTSGGANEAPMYIGFRSGFNYTNIAGYLVPSMNRFMVQYYDANGSYNISPGATDSSGHFYFAMNYQV